MITNTSFWITVKQNPGAGKLPFVEPEEVSGISAILLHWIEHGIEPISDGDLYFKVMPL